MNLRICILPAKVLTDGTHKVRIAISHKGNTRYFVTRFVIPSADNISNGRIVGVDNSTYINKQLTIQMQRIYEAFDKIEDAEYLTCSQLLTAIEDNMVAIKPRSLYEVANEYLTSLKAKTLSKGTIYLYEQGLSEIKNFFGEDFVIRNLNTDKVNEYMTYLKKKLGDTTVNIRMRFLKLSVSYAKRHKYASFDVSPFEDVHVPTSLVRDCAVSLEEIRKVRDFVVPEGVRHKNIELARDTFMASFFLCGMNITDILSVDFSGNDVSFKRTKTKSRRKNAPDTVFAIQPEARAYLDKIFKNGKYLYHNSDPRAITTMLYENLNFIAELLGIKKRFIFYSARKSFAQLANELMIKDSIIEYCLGDTVSTSGKVIGHYINVNRRMADKAIRKVFDAVASDKSIEELVEDAI